MKHAFTVLLLGCALAHEARADVPGPREVCDAEGLTCESCWQSYSSESADKSSFETCAAPLRDKGYTEGCRHRQGAGDQVFFCANGAKPKVVTRNFGGDSGCASCAVFEGRGEDGGAALALSLLAVAGLAFRRPRR